MTRVTYDTFQFSEGCSGGWLPGPYISPANPAPIHGRIIASSRIRTAYMPTRLVRVSDMQVVQGSTVTERYCALSYARSNRAQKSDPDTDNQQHKIITYVEDDIHKILAIKSTKTRTARAAQTYAVADAVANSTTHRVTFQKLIQRICQDFGIRYIWYDQLCDVHQTEQENEGIKDMHQIYRNAHYTVVLIPELTYDPKEDVIGADNWQNAKRMCTKVANSELCNQTWPFAEAFISRNLLIVGRNTHTWSASIGDPRRSTTMDMTRTTKMFVYSLCSSSVSKTAISSPWSTRAILQHFRSKQNTYSTCDSVFALANIFNCVIPEMNDLIRYDQSVDELMLRFYGLLVQYDASLLCIGEPTSATTAAATFIDEKHHGDERAVLVSWMGDIYKGCRYRDMEFIPRQVQNIDISGTLMHIKCKCISVSINKDTSSRVVPEDLYFRQGEQGKPVTDKSLTFLSCSVKTYPEQFSNSHIIASVHGLHVSCWLPLREDGDLWVNCSPTKSGYNGGCLSLTDDDCTECLILSDLVFETSNNSFKALPVVAITTKHVDGDDKHYRFIGLCILWKTVPLKWIEIERELVIE
ncbi:hypothetical protein BDB00DRAFT_851281 [Zychaea mexicana]|uniref:uncharacterized protein n=1 Tax=Zychaea mexicana TaxID=64656 RepID=UPI0022FE9D9F|nr:uncharacterized protein BDB00DRAFT_851281 [Zychaea mexicana]KAI9485152.1 hypothetical protein BDB00DRAFT_851281 [Zychaea mexicana]